MLIYQILQTGFFHADPHPGNLAIDVDEAIIYYDFGMMGEIKSFTRERLLELFYAIYEKDAKKVCFYFLNIYLFIYFHFKDFCSLELREKKCQLQPIIATSLELFDSICLLHMHARCFLFYLYAATYFPQIVYTAKNSFSHLQVVGIQALFFQS